MRMSRWRSNDGTSDRMVHELGNPSKRDVPDHNSLLLDLKLPTSGMPGRASEAIKSSSGFPTLMSCDVMTVTNPGNCLPPTSREVVK